MTFQAQINSTSESCFNVITFFGFIFHIKMSFSFNQSQFTHAICASFSFHMCVNILSQFNVYLIFCAIFFIALNVFCQAIQIFPNVKFMHMCCWCLCSLSLSFVDFVYLYYYSWYTQFLIVFFLLFLSFFISVAVWFDNVFYIISISSRHHVLCCERRMNGPISMLEALPIKR